MPSRGQRHWVQDREFGLQFKVDMLNSTAPTTKEGIGKYLGSGMVKGIGPKRSRTTRMRHADAALTRR